MKKQISLLACLVFISFNITLAQEFEPINNFVGFGLQYGIDIPAGDLADRYGTSFHVTPSVEFYNSKLNGMYGLEASIQFGSNVNEDVLESIRSSSGAILGFNGGIADVFLRRRGLYIGAFANKTIFKTKRNPASGLNLGIGAGLFQHEVRLLDDTASATQLRSDYAKGYDRLTRGPALKQSINYLNIGLNRSVNYSIGLSIIEGFTESVRLINFDTQQSAKGSRLDILISLEAKWIIPLRKTGGIDADEIYY